MKKLILILIMASIAGCSSSDEKSDSGVIAPPKAGKKGSKTQELEQVQAPPSYVPKKGHAMMAKAFDDKNYKELFEVAGQLLSVNPNDAQALNFLALYHMTKSEWGAARLLLERALEKNKDNAGLYNNLGVIALREDNLESAIINFKTAYDKSRSNPNVLSNLGSIYVKYLDYGKGEGMIEQSYSSMSDSTGVTNNYAIIKRVQGKFDQSADLYKKILAKDPRNVSTILNYAILLIEYMKKYEEGEKLLNKLEFLESNEPYVKTKVAELHTKIQAARK